MALFTAMFVPTLTSLAAGIKPATWLIGTDDGDAAADQILQRATSRAARTLGHADTVYAPPADAVPGLPEVELFASGLDETPVGIVTWVEMPARD